MGAPPRAVAVTGIGVVSALGLTRAEFWRALVEGRSGIRPITLVDCAPLRFKHGAEVPDYDPAARFDQKQLQFLDRFAQLALLAVREAVADADVSWSDPLRERTAVVSGTSIGGQGSQDAGFAEVYLRGSNRVHPLTVPRIMPNAGASEISRELGITGPVYTVSTACASASHAIGQAFWMVRDGIADLALAGGSEAPISFGMLKAWEALRVVSPTTCRPFSRDRDGMILGEGAGFLVLEPRERAEARGARVYAEVAGFGMGADAHHLTQPSVEGPERVMRAALADARLDPDDVGYVNAHGTATDLNDVTESEAIRRVFGARAGRLPVSSTKSMHGHALGAAGGLEAAATVLALAESLLPPTANFTEPDPRCGLDCVPNQARPARVGSALSNSFAFGGLNAVLAFRRA